MPVRRLLAVGLWLGVTALATATVWAGTSTVAADLTDRPPPVVTHQDVVEALQPGEPAAETDPGITTPPAGPASTVASGAPESAAPAAESPAGGGPGPAAQPPSVAAPVPSTTPPTTRPSSSPPTTRAPERPRATFSTAGGSATVGCTGPFYFFAELVSATPANGYAVNVVSAGPYYVEVHFVRPGRDEPLWVYCLGQPIRAYGGIPEGRFRGQ